MTPNLIPVLVNKQDAEGDSRCDACGMPLPFGAKAWQDEARSVLACRNDSQVCQIQLSGYVALLLDEAEDLLLTQGELILVSNIRPDRGSRNGNPSSTRLGTSKPAYRVKRGKIGRMSLRDVLQPTRYYWPPPPKCKTNGPTCLPRARPPRNICVPARHWKALQPTRKSKPP